MDSPNQSPAERAHRILSAHNLPDLLYGAIVAGSVLAVSSVHVESGARVALATAAVTVIYWLAHVYVEAVGNRFRDREHTMRFRVVEAMRDSAEVLAGAVAPIVVFVVARFFTADIELAATIALWATVLILLTAGAGAGYLAGVRGWALVLESAVSGAFGVLMIVLKYFLH